jgi:tRNA threonylcarbamoyl adenosine modification protein YjeE
MPPVHLNLAAQDVRETQDLAAALALQCAVGDCILLVGDLGSGKTTFARGFIRALCGAREDIVSPTFTLVQNYQAKSGATICHFDLYRLKKQEEVIEIGLEEALESGITLIEWPQLMQGRLPANALEVRFAYGNGETRTIILTGEEKIWQSKLAALQQQPQLTESV